MVTWKYTDMYLQKCQRIISHYWKWNFLVFDSCCISVFFKDISLLSGKKRTWFVIKEKKIQLTSCRFQFEKSMYTLSQNMISFCFFSAQPHFLLLTRWLHNNEFESENTIMSQRNKFSWKMNTLTVTNTTFFLQMLSFLIMFGRTFQACIQKTEIRHSICYSAVNTFIMLDWGASKQLHSTFMNTGSCLVSAFMQCSCFYMSFVT